MVYLKLIQYCRSTKKNWSECLLHWRKGLITFSTAIVQVFNLLMYISREIKVKSQKALCPQRWGEGKGRGTETLGGQHHGVCLPHDSDGSMTRPRALRLIESTAEAHVVYSSAHYRRLSFTDYNIKLVALTQHKINAHAVGHVLQLCFLTMLTVYRLLLSPWSYL